MRKFLFNLIAVISFFLFFTNISWAGSWQLNSQVLNYIYAMVVAPDGSIWVGGNNGYVVRWNGSSWKSYQVFSSTESVTAMTVASDGSIWVGGNDGHTARWNGSFWESKGIALVNGFPIYAMTATPDGSIWAGGYDGYTARWNGSSWESKGFTLYSNRIYALAAAPDGSIWAAGDAGYTARWNGSSWENKGKAFSSNVRALTVATDGSIWAGGDGGYTARWNGSSWELKGRVPNNFSIFSMTTAPDGSIWVGGYASYGNQDRIARWNGTSWESKGNPFGGYYIQGLVVAPDGSIWAGASNGRTATYDFGSSPFSLVASPNGPTGNLNVNPRFDGAQIVRAVIQYSTNGTNFSDLYTCNAGSTKAFTPSANSYWFRLKWQWRPSPAFSWQNKYTNIYGPVPAITTTQTVNANTGVQTWDAVRGRSWVTLGWGSVYNATGYKLYIFDGYTYRSTNLGASTSWDSRTAKIFPFPGELPENNSISSDIFHWDGSGLDFEDTSLRLYRSTSGTSYDSINQFYFRVTAYNQWMETYMYASSASKVLTLPDATDSAAPSGTISVTVPEGATAPADVTIDLSAVTDSESGLYQMRFSNDGSAYSAWEPFATSKVWTTSSGEGEKTVYAQVKDNVGNVQTFSVSFWLGATLTQIYNEAKGSAQKAEAARLAAEGAKTSADAAKTAAENAASSADLAATNAEKASDQTWYSGIYGGSSESVADIAGYIRNTQLPGIENKIDNLQTVVNNINNYIGADTTAPSLDWATVSGAYSTSGSSIDIIITASDNVSSNLEYSINGGAYSALPSDGIVSAPVTNSGPNAIVVRVRDEAGNVASKVRTVWKL